MEQHAFDEDLWGRRGDGRHARAPRNGPPSQEEIDAAIAREAALQAGRTIDVVAQQADRTTDVRAQLLLDAASPEPDTPSD